MKPAYEIREEIDKRLNGRKLKDVKGKEREEIGKLVNMMMGQMEISVAKMINHPEDM